MGRKGRRGREERIGQGARPVRSPWVRERHGARYHGKPAMGECCWAWKWGWGNSMECKSHRFVHSFTLSLIHPIKMPILR